LIRQTGDGELENEYQAKEENGLKLEPASFHGENEQGIYSWTTKERSSVSGVEELRS
jgi:hypothetical protein